MLEISQFNLCLENRLHYQPMNNDRRCRKKASGSFKDYTELKNAKGRVFTFISVVLFITNSTP